MYTACVYIYIYTDKHKPTKHSRQKHWAHRSRTERIVWFQSSGESAEMGFSPKKNASADVGLSENRLNPYTQWFCWSLSLLNGYNWGYTPFSDIPMWQDDGHNMSQYITIMGCSWIFGWFWCVFLPKQKTKQALRSTKGLPHAQLWSRSCKCPGGWLSRQWPAYTSLAGNQDVAWCLHTKQSIE